jgi:hypothetical protein
MLRNDLLSFPWKRLYISQSKAVPSMMTALRTHGASWSTDACRPHNVRFEACDAAGNPLFPLAFQGGYLSVSHPEEGQIRCWLLVGWMYLMYWVAAVCIQDLPAGAAA